MWGLLVLAFLGAIVVTRVLGLHRLMAQWAQEKDEPRRARAMTLAGRFIAIGFVVAVLGGLLNAGVLVGIGFAAIAMSIMPLLYYVGAKLRERRG